jgi:endogenous inhibitor of DNA gyrase (YacG/DUF329 family)
MTIAFGNSIEPGGMELDDDRFDCTCPECGKQAKERLWDTAEGGSVNSYYSISCPHCGYHDTDWDEP